MKDEDTQNTEEMIDDVTFEPSTEDGDALPTKDVVKKLRADLKQARVEKEEYLTGWQRAKADYVNLQKDEEGKRKDLKTFITANMVEDFLPAMDSFDMAFKNKEAWEKVDPNWRSGVEYIYQQFLRAFEANNISVINTAGVPFDHNLHEAIETITTDNEQQDHTVASIIQSGYKIGERVIRPARVNVYEYKQ